MSASLTRRSKVLLALVASMTLGSGLLLGLAPPPLQGPLSQISLSALKPTTQPGADGLDAARLRTDWRQIVIHESHRPTGNLSELDRQYKDLFGGCPYHFVINADGTVEASARWQQQELSPQQVDGSATPGIQVVLIGKFDQRPPGPAQMKAFAELMERLRSRLHIPAESVFLHWQLQPMAEPCPGPAFPRTW